MIERRYISQVSDPDLETRANTEEDGKKYIIGYAALTNTQSRQLTEKINGQVRTFTESIAPDAFIEADISEVMYNVDHDPSKMVARTSAGNLQVKVTERGLFFRATLPNTTTASDLYENIQAGNYRENSFAFKVSKDTWENRGGTLYRTINKIAKVVDVSSVINGAYQADVLFTRSLDESILNEVSKTEEPQHDCKTIEVEFKMNELRRKSF